MADPTELAAGAAEEVAFEPTDAIAKVWSTSLKTGAGGLFIATIQSTLARGRVGPFGVFSVFGSTIAWSAGAGAAYAISRTTTANLRQKEDIWNALIGGFAAGAVIGLRRRTFPSVIGTGLAGAGVFGTLFVAQGRLFTIGMSAEDRMKMKEEHRRRFRRPYQELINEVGEGRGIYGPGYEERRAQRLKDNYGIEVQQPYYERKKAAGIETSAL